MPQETLIKVENVSKKFCRNLKKSLWYGVKDIFGEVTGNKNSKEVLRPEEFWSVDNVSFELKRGECLGLIGPNGAGKSTLLKMLNGLIKPDTGRISIRGRVGALIELGAGFNPILTGRENIHINGAVLGFTKKEIDSKFDEIVEFSEIGEFLDMPVQNYSSGMKVRLGFAVASQMKPDVLLIDEVLAVGDIGFRSKCYSRIAEIAEKSAIIFVSHQMPQVSKLCNNVLLNDKGKLLFYGNTSEGIMKYNELFGDPERKVSGTGNANVSNIKILGPDGKESYNLKYNEKCDIEFDLVVSDKYRECIISIGIMDRSGTLISQIHSEYNKIAVLNSQRKKRTKISLANMFLNPDIYFLNIIVFDNNNSSPLTWLQAAKKFKVEGDFFGGAPVQMNCQWNFTDE